MESITDIIRGCIGNNHKYQKIVYERYRGFAMRIVFRFIYHYERAIDIVNDGFVKLFGHFSKFEMAENGENERLLMGWLKKILINCAIDELRKGSMLPEIGGIPEYAWSIPGGPEADQLVLYKEMITFVKELPPGYRVVFNLYAIDGYSHQEIAELLGISAGTSKSNLSKARALLQQKVKRMEESKLCRI